MQHFWTCCQTPASVEKPTTVFYEIFFCFLQKTRGFVCVHTLMGCVVCCGNEAPAARRSCGRFFRSFPTSISVIRLGKWHQFLRALYSQFPHQQVLWQHESPIFFSLQALPKEQGWNEAFKMKVPDFSKIFRILWKVFLLVRWRLRKLTNCRRHLPKIFSNMTILCLFLGSTFVQFLSD